MCDGGFRAGKYFSQNFKSLVTHILSKNASDNAVQQAHLECLIGCVHVCVLHVYLCIFVCVPDLCVLTLVS